MTHGASSGEDGLMAQKRHSGAGSGSTSGPRPRVLFVDDEENILRALRRLFRAETWDMVFATSAAEALELFEQKPFDAVVTDQRMPGATGMELLRNIRTRAPLCARIVLSGYADVQTIVQAVNEGAIYKFLMKPWDDAMLSAVVREAVGLSEVRRENERLQSLVEEQNEELLATNLNLQGILSEEASVHAFIQALPVGVLAVREEGTVVLSNPAAERILGPLGSLEVDALAHRPGLEVREGTTIEAAGWTARTFVLWEK
jgi:response regulator RpfG family c-di-GMP phosphodiesterase